MNGNIRIISIFFSILLIGYYILGCGSSSSKPSKRDNILATNICGKVVEDRNYSKGIKDAKVFIIENDDVILTLNTNKEGSYCFDSTELSKETFLVRAIKEDYANTIIEVNNTNLSKINDISLTKLGKSITVPKSGKTIKLDDNISLVFPANAVNKDIFVQVTPIQMSSIITTDKNVTLFYFIDLRAIEIDTGDEIHHFNKPIELKILMNISENLNIDDLVFYNFDEKNNKFRKENVDKKIENGYLIIKLNHFSTKAIGTFCRVQLSKSFTCISSKSHSIKLLNGKKITVVQRSCTYARVAKIRCNPKGGGIILFTYKRGKKIHCCDGKVYCNLFECIPKGCKKKKKDCDCKPHKMEWCPLKEKEPKCTAKIVCPNGSHICPDKNCPPPPTGAEGGS